MISFMEGQVYLYSQPIDMRKSINGLSYIVNDQASHAPQDGSLTLFVRRAWRKTRWCKSTTG
jgi:transposase